MLFSLYYIHMVLFLDVYTDDGGDKFRVIEESDYCGLTGRCCCNPNHALKLHIFAPGVSDKDEVMIFDRPCKCGQCCSCCNICRQEMTVRDGEGGTLGYIKQPFLGGGFAPKLEVMERSEDNSGEHYATVEYDGFCCVAGLCCDHTFVLNDSDGNRNHVLTIVDYYSSSSFVLVIMPINIR